MTDEKKNTAFERSNYVAKVKESWENEVEFHVCTRNIVSKLIVFTTLFLPHSLVIRMIKTLERDKKNES